jgi:iron donor protein CyaY
MQASPFELLADNALLELSVILEENDDLEVSYEDGVLNIDSPQGGYTVNRHSVSQEIWFSSPISGVKYFKLQEGEWKEKRTGEILREALLSEF